MKQKRSFKIVDVRKQNGCKTKFNKNGRYFGSEPVRAAKKAFTQLCRDKKIRGACAFNVEIAETTVNSKKKHFMYHARRVKLDTPRVLDKNGTKVTYKYDQHIKSIKSMPTKCSTLSGKKNSKEKARKGGGDHVPDPPLEPLRGFPRLLDDHDPEIIDYEHDVQRLTQVQIQKEIDKYFRRRRNKNYTPEERSKFYKKYRICRNEVLRRIERGDGAQYKNIFNTYPIFFID